MAELSPPEVRNAVAVLHDGFAIDNRRLAAKLASGADDRGITAAPIVSVAGQNTCLTSLKQHLAAIAVV